MNSEQDSQKPQRTLFDLTPPPLDKAKLIFRMELPGRLPSWNDILGMEEWARYQFKKQLAESFMFELRRSARDSSTKTISVRSTLSTCLDTLESYLAMRLGKRKSNAAKKKQSRAQKSLFESKSSKSENLPF